jgi:hypothetical protein
VMCLVPRHGQPTSQHRGMRQQKHQALDESHGVYPIASRVSSGASYVPLGFRTNGAHMTVTSRDVFVFSHRPVPPSSTVSSLTAGESFSGKIVSLKLVLARNRYSLHYSFVHSPPGLRTAARNDTFQDSARTTVHASHNPTLSSLSTSASAKVSSYTQLPSRQPTYKFFPRHLHIFISATRLLLLLPPFTSQEDNDWLSDLRYGHTKIPNLEPQEDGSRSCSVTKFLLLKFRGQQVKETIVVGCISYSVVQKAFDSRETMIVAARECRPNRKVCERETRGKEEVD